MPEHYECGICGKTYREKKDAETCNHVKRVQTRGDPVCNILE